MTETNIAVVGPGAIGTTITAALRDAGHDPAVYGRTPRDRLELRTADDTIVIPGPVRTRPEKSARTADLVFLAVKATQIEGAARWLGALTHPGSVVCVLQNGVEQEAMVGPFVEAASVVPSVVWFPAQAQADGSILLRGSARLSLPDTSAAREVRDALAGSWCEVELAADFISVAWRKLLQNAAAGLMALTGRRMGMYSDPGVAQLTSSYLDECLAVARAEGAALGDEVPRAILQGFRSSPPDMGSSILADREAGRSLEWWVRNDVIRRRARAHGIPTPISDVLVPLLAAASEEAVPT